MLIFLKNLLNREVKNFCNKKLHVLSGKTTEPVQIDLKNERR